MIKFKKQSGFATAIIILIVAIVIVVGGVGYYFYLSRDEVLRDKTLSQELEKIEIYPDASKIELPSDLEEEIRGGLSSDAKITVYSSEDSVGKIKNWYESQLTDKGWEKIREDSEIIVWKKEEIGFGVYLVPGEEAPELGVTKEETLIFLLEDKFEVWKKFLGIFEVEKPEIEKVEEEVPRIEEKMEVIAFERFPNPYRGYSPALKERQGWVINSDKEWFDFWQLLFKGIGPDLPKKPPAITDFSAKTLLVVSAGEKPTGGFSMEVVKIVEYNGKLIVFTKGTQPGEGCAVTTALTTPMDFVVIPKTTLPVEFQFQVVQGEPCR